jgi:uncharacterized protein (DUF2147 family)
MYHSWKKAMSIDGRYLHHHYCKCGILRYKRYEEGKWKVSYVDPKNGEIYQHTPPHKEIESKQIKLKF